MFLTYYLDTHFFPGFGVQERLLLEFDEFFWDDRNLFFSLAPEVEADMGFLTTWINYHVMTERPILLGLLEGGGALVSHDMSDEDLKLKGDKYWDRKVETDLRDTYYTWDGRTSWQPI